MLKVLTHSSDPSSRMWKRTEQTTAIAMARCAGSSGSGSLTIADYATPGVRARSRPIVSRVRDEACASPLSNDVPGSRKVSGQDENARIDVALDEFATGHRRALRVGAEPARPLGLRHLHGPVHEITGEDSVTGSSRQVDRDVAGRVTRRRLEAKPRIHGMTTVDQHRLTGLYDGDYAVGNAQVLLVAPVLPFLAGEDVSRLGKGRHPMVSSARLALKTRVPAHVIHVKVRADHVVHVVGHGPRGAQVLEIAAVSHVPERIALAVLVVADARVDHDRVLGRPDDERLDPGLQIARGVIEEVWLQPRVMRRDGVRRRVRQHGGRGKRGAADLDHGGDGDLAELDRTSCRRHGRYLTPLIRPRRWRSRAEAPPERPPWSPLQCGARRRCRALARRRRSRAALRNDGGAHGSARAIAR